MRVMASQKLPRDSGEINFCREALRCLRVSQGPLGMPLVCTLLIPQVNPCVAGNLEPRFGNYSLQSLGLNPLLPKLSGLNRRFQGRCKALIGCDSDGILNRFSAILLYCDSTHFLLLAAEFLAISVEPCNLCTAPTKATMNIASAILGVVYILLFP